MRKRKVNHMKDKKQVTKAIACVVVAVIVLAVVAAAVLRKPCDSKDPTEPTGTSVETEPTSEPTAPVPSHVTEPTESDGLPEVLEKNEFDDGNPDTPSIYNPAGTPSIPKGKSEFHIDGFTSLSNISLGDIGSGLEIAAVGRYSGKYMEDGSDDPIENVLALIVKNNGDSIVEYTELSAKVGDQTASFKITALPVHGYVFVLESEKLIVDADAEVALPEIKQLAWITDVIVDYSEDFEVYLANGALNIVNISGKDYHNDVFVYYKTFENDIYMGGITYRARFSDGVANGAIAQALQNHVTGDRSVVFYMAYDE